MYDPNSVALGALVTIVVIVVCWGVFKFYDFVKEVDRLKLKTSFLAEQSEYRLKEICGIYDRLAELEEESKND